MRLRAHIPVLLSVLFLVSSLHGQWRKRQLDDGDMAADLAEALTFTKYPTYPQYVEMLQHFARTYPEICRVDTFGTTSQGRLLLAVKISDNVEEEEAEAAFLYTSSMHGDELMGYPLLLRLIFYLLTGYGEDPEVDLLVDQLAIWINPLANPDGTYYPDMDLSVAQAVRETSDGTDMNREFPDPVAGDLLNDTAGRAKETKAMMAFLQKHRFTMSANIHSGAEVVNYPWDHTYSLHADNGWFYFVSREYADEARAVDPAYMSLFTDGITNGALWYPISGGRQDYVTYFLEGREVTLELCNEDSLDSDFLNVYWQKNERSLLNYMAQCLYGIRGRVSDLESGLPVEARVEIPAHDHYYSAVHSSASHGDFYRLIEEGLYDLVISAPGYHSDTITGVAVSNYHSKWLDISLVPHKNSAELWKASTLRIYPNPVQNRLFIRPGKGQNGPFEITIYSTDGILQRQERVYSTGSAFSIPMEQISTGLYLIRISSGEHISTRMLFKE